MSEAIKILWSGLTGRTGQEAIKITQTRSDVAIIAGIRREICGGIDYEGAIDFNERTGFAGKWYRYRDLNRTDRPQPKKANALVDFSDKSAFDQVVKLAVHMHVPLISGTSGLSNRQMAMLYDATNQIPVFRGGNFRFKVKKFIDEAVELARKCNSLVLNEQYWEGQALPGQTDRELGLQILGEIEKTIPIKKISSYKTGSLVNEWVLIGDNNSSTIISYRFAGFSELAHDVLEIAKVMANKPIKPGEFYTLDDIWDDISESAKAI